ncbi:MAG: HAD hydrolase family protein [Candidatus Symbiothrix sp.]|jgi:3-deoxy-D-manno-octulosonate 8-phosphate phosphatase (KDO 8-P phosphatase)|nr:HAD hydrolase family protein [Candidatus Symbiothrix sp.]
MSTINHDLTTIKAFVFDIDGVLSGETIPLHPNGEPMRFANTKDGYAMATAARQGFVLGIITGSNTEAVRKRYEGLGFKYIYQKSKRKLDDLHDFIQKTGLKAEDICYVGDDIPDSECLQAVGLPACPADAVPEIKAVSKYISHKNGGDGVGRDIIEQVLKAQDKWPLTGNASW